MNIENAQVPCGSPPHPPSRSVYAPLRLRSASPSSPSARRAASRDLYLALWWIAITDALGADTQAAHARLRSMRTPRHVGDAEHEPGLHARYTEDATTSHSSRWSHLRYPEGVRGFAAQRRLPEAAPAPAEPMPIV